MSSIQSKIMKGLFRLFGPKGTKLTDQNLAAKRLASAKYAKFFPVSRSVTIKPQKIDGLTAEWLITPRSRDDYVMLYMHGGGFVFDNTKLHRDMISRIASAGRVKALSLNYSLAPEHPYPAALNETIKAYRWLLDQKIDPKRIILAGDSSGGSLVLSALLTMSLQKLPYPACGVAISPATDATLGSLKLPRGETKEKFLAREGLPYYIKSYFQKTPHDDPIASPFFGSLKGLPPLLLHATDNEALYGDSARFVEKARRAGVEVEFYQEHDLWHIWHLYARVLPEARSAIKNIGEFIEAHLEA